MKYIILALTLSVSAFVFTASAQKVPTFAQYGAKVEKIKHVAVDLKSHKDARMFRTNLRNAAKEGVNFAGHYILTGWGCGTNCSEWAIIDARNGRVFFPREFQGVVYGFCDGPENAMPSDAKKVGPDEADGPLYFKPNSRMVVLTGFTGRGMDSKTSQCGNYFLEWTGTTLKQLKLIPGKRMDTP